MMNNFEWKKGDFSYHGIGMAPQELSIAHDGV